MRPLELLLLAMNAVSLLALAWGRAPRGLGYLPTVVAGLTLADLLLAGFCPLMTPLYLTGGLLFLLTRGRLRELRRPARVRRALRTAGGALGLLALSLATVITAGTLAAPTTWSPTSPDSSPTSGASTRPSPATTRRRASTSWRAPCTSSRRHRTTAGR